MTDRVRFYRKVEYVTPAFKDAGWEVALIEQQQ